MVAAIVRFMRILRGMWLNRAYPNLKKTLVGKDDKALESFLSPILGIIGDVFQRVLIFWMLFKIKESR